MKKNAMSGNGQVVGMVLARGGSKGVPGKNIKRLGGIPLIGWTLRAAKNSNVLDRIIVSTDDPNIAKCARQYGGEVPFMRSKSLATDASSSVDAVLHALDFLKRREGYEPEFTFLLQPTAPFRSAEDIRAAVSFLKGPQGKRFDAIVGISPVQKHPSLMYTLGRGGLMQRLMKGKVYSRRQEYPDVYAVNGAVYLCRTSVLRGRKRFYPPRTYGLVIPLERGVDMDTVQDFCFAESLLREGVVG